MSDRIEDLGVVDARDARRRPSAETEASPASVAFVLGLLMLAIGMGALGFSYRDLATAVGLALATPGVVLIAGAIFAKRYGR